MNGCSAPALAARDAGLVGKVCRLFGYVALLAALAPFCVHAQVAFTGPELIGRATNDSITINVVPNAAIDAYVQYGTSSGVYANQTATVSTTAGEPLEIVIGNLLGNTLYYYRMVYRASGTATWINRAEHSFMTQRAPGSTFTFTVTSDSHVNIVFGNSSLWQRTLQNALADQPDVHFDLGDTFAMDSVTTQSGANSSYLNQRSYFGLLSHSVPVYLVLGNHEEEEGWHLDDTGNEATSQPVIGANARKRYYLNPVPGLFYSGDSSIPSTAISGDHLPEDYYAFEWGDALFVAIDPFWYTSTKPYTGNTGGGESSDPGSGDRWDWTLGSTQYQWLKRTLENSKATFKFVFAHHVAGGTVDYGRGCGDAVPYVEWGGYDTAGSTWGWNTRRAGWDAPIHQLLKDNHVTVFFCGHDHEFVHQQRDGVVYQVVPMAADAGYGYGFDGYREGGSTLRVLPNSGHIRATVSPANVTISYVRAYLAGQGTNGSVAYSYSIPAPSGTPALAVSSLALNPATVLGGVANSTATITLNGPAPSGGAVVSLSSGNPSAATVPPSVTIPAAQSSATFTVTSLAVASASSSLITATLNGSVNTTLNVNAVATDLSSLVLNPTSVVGGAASSTAAVTLNGFAPPGGISVALSSNNPSAATVPVSVLVPGDSSSATFTVTTLAVSSSQTATITATLSTSRDADLTVKAAPSFAPVRINSGGSAAADSLGQVWSADMAYSGGAPYSANKTIANTADQALYRKARYGSSFSYAIPAPAGTYSVTLKFAELYWPSAGQRIFNVAINGATVLSNFDIVAAAGGSARAVDRTFPVTSSGTISIELTRGTAGNPLVNAVQVVSGP